jgi:Domain of Unknown Function (DUF326)
MEKQKLIDVLYFCAGQCTHCYDACHLNKENNMELCMINDQDCSEICRLTGQLLERNSPNVDIFLKLCVQMCERCANECDKNKGMSHCEECAAACRKCAEMCQQNELAH